jgi:hypothetical protein
VCTALLLSTSQVWAQSDFSRFEYSVGTTWGIQSETLLSMNLDTEYSDTTFLSTITRMIKVLAAQSDLSQRQRSMDTYARFDPEFSTPDAFRRPRQARLSFHFRFR